MDVNRRRMAEEQRKRRIFNSKWRQIGLDVDALNHQVHEKALSRTKEQQRECAFAEEAQRQSDLAELLEQEQNDEALEKNKKVDEFRKSQQRPEQRREFDLNDPNAKKRERPPRASDDDPCPPSSLQKFHGEDLDRRSRSRSQKDQVRDLLLQQMQEKRLRDFKEDASRKAWEDILLQHDALAQQVARMEVSHTRERCAKLGKVNRDLATARQESEMRHKMEEDIAKKKDIQFQEDSDLLTENPLAGRSSLGSHRVVPDRWKGMDDVQRREFHEDRVKQVVEKKRMREQEEREDAKWDEVMLNNDLVAQLCEEEQKNDALERSKKLGSENQYLAQDQRCQKEHLDKVVYRNAATKEFFDQFNTTSR